MIDHKKENGTAMYAAAACNATRKETKFTGLTIQSRHAKQTQHSRFNA